MDSEIIQIETVCFSIILLILYTAVLVYIRAKKKHVLLQVVCLLFILNYVTSIALVLFQYFGYKTWVTTPTTILCNMTFFLGYWVFAWKYLPTALNVYRLHRGQNCGAEVLLYSMSSTIVVVTMVCGIFENTKIIDDTPKWLIFLAHIVLQMFFFADFLIVLVSLLMIHRALGRQRHLMQNTCRVWLLGVFLGLMLGMGLLRLILKMNGIIDSIYYTACFAASVIVAYIMYRT